SARADLAEVEVLEAEGLGTNDEAPGEQGIAARPLALHMVARDCDQLERLPRPLQPGQQRPAREPADDRLLVRRPAVLQLPPLSVLVLSAVAEAPPRKAAVPATRAVAPAPMACRAVSGSMPPSTSSSILRSCLAMRLAIASIFLSWPVMNFCPPKPGFTLMT